jgi:RNA polymerase sigma-70 factor (ECF subfamily)
MNPINLESIIAGCKITDTKSQSNLYDMYSKKYLKVVEKYCNDIRDREEVVNEAFIKIFSEINNYNYTGPFEAWMRRIVVHTAIDKTRSKSFKKIEHKTINIDFTTEGHNLISQIDFDNNYNIEKLFNKLTNKQQKIMTMVVNGLPTKEIAGILNTSDGNIRFHISDARKKLKESRHEFS